MMQKMKEYIPSCYYSWLTFTHLFYFCAASPGPALSSFPGHFCSSGCFCWLSCPSPWSCTSWTWRWWWALPPRTCPWRPGSTESCWAEQAARTTGVRRGLPRTSWARGGPWSGPGASWRCPGARSNSTGAAETGTGTRRLPSLRPGELSPWSQDFSCKIWPEIKVRI